MIGLINFSDRLLSHYLPRDQGVHQRVFSSLLYCIATLTAFIELVCHSCAEGDTSFTSPGAQRQWQRARRLPQRSHDGARQHCR
jgi:hypothetical protein